MHRRLALTTAAALFALSGCTSETGLSVEDELTLTAVQGEEEDLDPGAEGDFSSGCMNGDRGDEADVDRPPLFRPCDAERTLDEIVAFYDANGDGDLGPAERQDVLDARYPDGDAQAGPGAGGSNAGGPGGDSSGLGGDQAGPGAGAERPGRDDHRRMRRVHRWMKLVRIYDFDRDGELSEDERDALLADFTERCDALHQRALDEFDADGDGELSDDERQAARDAAQARRADRRDAMLDEYDTDGDGELSRDELHAMHEARRAEHEERRQACLDAFDADGDGEWSDEEHAAFTDAMRERIRTGQNLRCTE